MYFIVFNDCILNEHILIYSILYPILWSYFLSLTTSYSLIKLSILFYPCMVRQDKITQGTALLSTVLSSVSFQNILGTTDTININIIKSWLYQLYSVNFLQPPLLLLLLLSPRLLLLLLLSPPLIPPSILLLSQTTGFWHLKLVANFVAEGKCILSMCRS